MKVARTVLRGERGSNAPDLLDHRGLFHHSDCGKLDSVGWRDYRLQPQRDESGGDNRGGGRCGNRENRRETFQIINNYNFLGHGI